MVRFIGDNDFIYTVTAFMKAIAPRIFNDSWKDITKAEIVSLFNEHAYSLYCLHQTWDLKLTEADSKRIKDYLTIDEDHVYFDDEVKEFTNFNHDGCCAYVNWHDNQIIYTTI
jgi:hypothetical protein